MKHKFFKPALNAIIEIWHYTDKNWGEYQADKYIRGIYSAVEDAANRQHWRNLKDKRFDGVHFIRYEHHFIFFRKLSQGRLGVISILHERMNIPDRLEGDLSFSNA